MQVRVAKIEATRTMANANKIASTITLMGRAELYDSLILSIILLSKRRVDDFKIN